MATVGDRRPPGVYFDSLSSAWGILSRELPTWIGATLLLIVLVILSYVVVQIGSGQPLFSLDPNPNLTLDQQVRETVLQLATSVITTAISTSMLAMATRQARGETIQFADLFLGFRRIGAFTGLLLITVVVATLFAAFLAAVFFATRNPFMILLGALVAIPLMIWLYPTIVYGQMRLVLTEEPLFTALYKAYRKATPHALAFFALYIVLFLIVLISFFLCFFPVLFAIPFATMVVGMHYLYLFGDEYTTFTPAIPIGQLPPE